MTAREQELMHAVRNEAGAVWGSFFARVGPYCASSSAMIREMENQLSTVRARTLMKESFLMRVLPRAQVASQVYLVHFSLSQDFVLRIHWCTAVLERGPHTPPVICALAIRR